MNMFFFLFPVMSRLYLSRNFFIDMILPHTPMLMPRQRKMISTFLTRKSAGTTVTDIILAISDPIILTILV